MADEWIKLRKKLWNHPTVQQIACALSAGTDLPPSALRAQVVGGLFRVWCLADDYSTDGTLPGYTVETVDEETGVRGFAAALVSTGWLEVSAEGVTVPRFTEHNTASARLRDQRRVRAARAALKAQEKRSRREKREERSVEPPTPANKSPATSRDLTVPLALDNETGRAAIDRWLAYKQERREGYKTGDYLERTLRRFASAEDLDAAVDEATTAGWKGLFARSNGKAGTDHATGPGQKHKETKKW